MTISPTLDGGLKLVPEEEQDWLVLLNITTDGKGDLAQKLAGLMDDEAMWEEIVMPELDVEFSKQREFVLNEVMRAKNSESGELHIDRKNVELWFGAINQARLALEERYKLGPRELRDPAEASDSQIRSAMFREEFYLSVQSLLLDFVMVD